MTSLAHLVGMIYDLKTEVERRQLLQQRIPLDLAAEHDTVNGVVKRSRAGASDATFEIALDVGSFASDEITVKVREHEITVRVAHGEREEAGEIGFIARQFTRRFILPDECDANTVSACLTNDGKLTIRAGKKTTTTDSAEMDEMILHCNQNTVYVLNTSYTSYGEFDMIGLFGTQTAGFRHTSSPAPATYKTKSKATNVLLDNQISASRLKEVNNNLAKKRPHFLKFFHDSLFKANSIESDSSSASPKDSYMGSTPVVSARKASQKTSKELYREAAQILGITCEFDESCRCIECQSRYFDCDCDDDESDTFSNLSALIDADEFSAHVDSDGFYCNGNDENCNFNGYVVEQACDANAECDDVDAAAKE